MNGPPAGNLFASSSFGDMPLAARMRPQTLDEMVGQQHLLAEDSQLRKAIEADRLPSMLLCGPAGSGKSTLAGIVARMTRHHFEPLSAVQSGVTDLRAAAARAKENLSLHDRRTIVFIDEIHRLNKGQQDCLLPYVEEGTFVFIGATTENPYFSIIAPLRSRCRVYALEPLSVEDITAVLRRALTDAQRGLGGLGVGVSDEALAHLAEGCNGDARTALGALELAVLSVAGAGEEGVEVDLETAAEALQRPVLKYDRAGDEHYDTISAYIKAMRGSDPDAAIYWLAKMLEAGEDPRFVARRLVIAAAEDVGLADPTALRVALAAADAVEYVGMPEAQIPLAMGTIHVATAPKSNSAYLAIKKAREDVAREGAARVPGHLAGGMRAEGVSDKRYRYPHDYPGGWVAQAYLPEGLEARKYYEPGQNRREQQIAEYLQRLRNPGARGPQAARDDSIENRD